jgi:V/A-type H+-transporting ATPase subunit F
MHTYKLAIVGTREAIIGFKALGLDPVYASSPREALDALYELKKEKAEVNGESKNKYAIIYIMEDLMSSITDDDYKKLSADPLPAIIPLPSHLGSSGYGLKKLKTIVEKAVGMDILN